MVKEWIKDTLNKNPSKLNTRDEQFELAESVDRSVQSTKQKRKMQQRF